MVSEPVPNQHDIFRADQPPLSDLLSVHAPENTERGNLSSDKNKILCRAPRKRRSPEKNQLTCQCQRGCLRQNEKCWGERHLLGHGDRMLIPEVALNFHHQRPAVFVPDPAWRGQNLTFCAICWLCSLRRCP